MTAPTFYVADHGEVVGLLQRFSARLGLTPASVLECLRRRAPGAVVLDAGEGRNRLLALRAEGLLALYECASGERLPASRS